MTSHHARHLITSTERPPEIVASTASPLPGPARSLTPDTTRAVWVADGPSGCSVDLASLVGDQDDAGSAAVGGPFAGSAAGAIGSVATAWVGGSCAAAGPSPRASTPGPGFSIA